MTMRCTQKLFLTACAALSGLPAVLAGPWRDPISGELSCVDAQGIPQCSTQYRVRSSCGGENAQACVRAWCNQFKQLVEDESAHVTLEQCAAENAESSARRALGANNAIDGKELSISFRVKGDVYRVGANVNSGLGKIHATANSDYDYLDDNKDGKFLRADEAFSVADSELNQAECLNFGKKYKHISGADTCKAPDSSLNSAIVSHNGNTVQVTSGDSDHFKKGEWIKIVDNTDSNKFSYYKVTVQAVSTTATFTVTRLGPNGNSHTSGATGHIVHHLGAHAPQAALAANVDDNANTTTLTLNTDQGTLFEKGDRIQVGSEIMHVHAVASSTTLTVTRGWAGTTRKSHASSAVVSNLTACRKVGCEAVSCGNNTPVLEGNGGNMCVTADKWEPQSNASGLFCSYYNCKKEAGEFANDSGCCQQSKHSCNTKFQNHAADDDDKNTDTPDDRTKCAANQHVAFEFCDTKPCHATNDKAKCCVSHNSTGKEFGASTEVALKAKFSTGTSSCQLALRYPGFFQHLSDAVAKSLGKKPWEVVLVKAPACPRVRALRSLEDATFELEALFSIKGALPKVDAKTGRHLDMETRAQAAYVAFLSSLLG